MARPIIEAVNISKSYTIGKRESYGSLREEIMQALASPFRKSTSSNEDNTVWALKDVSFDVAEGEVLGIIGRNGAGKSTLLKILSRITEPTTGRIVIRGRVASLLEVGTGFHPELTGRENIFLNGALLGMTNAEIKSKFDEIVAFSEIEKFLDTPVKRYSSGMYVRLAFAVAAHLEPEILIVDEVLAVGDAAFQKKCLGKMGDVAKGGRTVLFVSHNMGAVRAICEKGMCLESGTVRATGDIESVIDGYMGQGAALNDIRHHYINKTPISSKKAEKAECLEVYMADRTGSPAAFTLIDQPFSINIDWRLNREVPFLRVGVDIIDSSGAVVLSTFDTDTTDLHGKPRSPGVFSETVSVPAFLLMPGVYTVQVFAGMPMVERIMEENDVIRFEVLDNNSHLSHVTGGRRAGFISTPLKWRVERKDA